jgi:hypothetical protein
VANENAPRNSDEVRRRRILPETFTKSILAAEQRLSPRKAHECEDLNLEFPRQLFSNVDVVVNRVLFAAASVHRIDACMSERDRRAADRTPLVRERSDMPLEQLPIAARWEQAPSRKRW